MALALSSSNRGYAGLPIPFGWFAVAMSDGTVQTYTPVPTDPAIHPFGRFRWINGVTIRCSRVFYQSGEPMAIACKKIAQPGEAVVMASSRDQKLLVAHRNQLAVFLIKPNKRGVIDAKADVMWTTRLEQSLVLTPHTPIPSSTKIPIFLS